MAGQRVVTSPGYRVSTWAARDGLLGGTPRVRASFLNAKNETVGTTELLLPTGPRYRYREGMVIAPRSAVALEVLLLGAHFDGFPTFVDDVRVLDANLLSNGGFETPAPTGREDETPGWRFEGASARVVTEAANVRGGARAVALDGLTEGFRQVVQEITEQPGGGARPRVCVAQGRRREYAVDDVRAV